MVRVEIICPKDAPRVLSVWETEDFYYSSMKRSTAGEINMKARGHPYIPTPEAEPSSREVEFDLPLDGPIHVVFLDGRADAGLPHTRGKSGIALPVFLIWHKDEKTLRHELVHLSQKQHTARWLEWYHKHWHFRPAREEEFMTIPERWRSRRRINPDTLGNPYFIWQTRYIPLSIFINEESPDLRYCKRGFWDIKMSQWTWQEPPDWVKTFGSGFNDEHPNEIAAHWIDGSAGKEKAAFFHLHPI